MLNRCKKCGSVYRMYSFKVKTFDKYGMYKFLNRIESACSKDPKHTINFEFEISKKE